MNAPAPTAADIKALALEVSDLRKGLPHLVSAANAILAAIESMSELLKSNPRVDPEDALCDDGAEGDIHAGPDGMKVSA